MYSKFVISLAVFTSLFLTSNLFAQEPPKVTPPEIERAKDGTWDGVERRQSERRKGQKTTEEARTTQDTAAQILTGRAVEQSAAEVNRVSHLDQSPHAVEQGPHSLEYVTRNQILSQIRNFKKLSVDKISPDNVERVAAELTRAVSIYDGKMGWDEIDEPRERMSEAFYRARGYFVSPGNLMGKVVVGVEVDIRTGKATTFIGKVREEGLYDSASGSFVPYINLITPEGKWEAYWAKNIVALRVLKGNQEIIISGDDAHLNDDLNNFKPAVVPVPDQPSDLHPSSQLQSTLDSLNQLSPGWKPVKKLHEKVSYDFYVANGYLIDPNLVGKFVVGVSRSYYDHQARTFIGRVKAIHTSEAGVWSPFIEIMKPDGKTDPYWPNNLVELRIFETP